MSMTLILWKAPVVSDPDQAKALLTPWYINGDESAFEPSPDLARVYEMLVQTYPLEPASDPTNPWADGVECTDRLLTLSLRWGVESRILADVVVLAAGTLGSTEILLRSRGEGLPTSSQLGRRFSGNGDVLAFAYDVKETEVRGIGVGRRQITAQNAVSGYRRRTTRGSAVSGASITCHRRTSPPMSGPGGNTGPASGDGTGTDITDVLAPNRKGRKLVDFRI